jgi:hypothetical protein
MLVRAQTRLRAWLGITLRLLLERRAELIGTIAITITVVLSHALATESRKNGEDRFDFVMVGFMRVRVHALCSFPCWMSAPAAVLIVFLTFRWQWCTVLRR